MGKHSRLHFPIGSGILLWSLVAPLTQAQFNFESFASALASSTVQVGPPRSSSTTDASAALTTLLTSVSAGAALPNSTEFALTTTQRDSAPKTTANGQISNPADDPPDRQSGLLNYYFVFLALFILLLFLGAYLVHRRKRALKARYRNSGQNALARDLDGWTGTRRWMHGGWRGGDGTAGRTEGLNELGEAPPPYKPAGEGPEGAGNGPPQIPLATLSRGEASMPQKPPGYGEAVRESRIVVDQDDRPPTAFPGMADVGLRTQPGGRS